MRITHGFEGREDNLVELFRAAFTASEGREEGVRIGQLVDRLIYETPAADIAVFCAEETEQVVAAAVFTRMVFADDPQTVMLLSPMAVANDFQRRGMGRRLLQQGLGQMRSQGVDVVLTYGDPNYYHQVGFHAITPSQVRPPLPLSMPYGWLGQALALGGEPHLRGPSSCVTALNDPALW